jgi:2-keto-4-pentenoate hydratase/2-oxohepta-3-ene-1,7-dioic acid hydratase in catechol pathway
MKPNSAIGDRLQSRVDGEALHFEAEIAFLIEGGELSAVALGLDLTRRGLQSRLKHKGLPWERSKAFDGAALFSSFVPLNDPDNLNTLTLELLVDTEVRQSGGVDLMLHKPQAILAEIKSVLTLEDGDIIMTGTPSGVGEVISGQKFTGRVLQGDRLLVEAQWIAH